MADQDDSIVNLDDLEEDENQSSDDSTVDYEPSSDVVDIDQAMKDVIGNDPDPTEPFSLADEVEDDEADRRDAPDD